MDPSKFSEGWVGLRGHHGRLRTGAFLDPDKIVIFYKLVRGAFVTLPRRKGPCTGTPALTFREAGVSRGVGLPSLSW
jgi:hypothetical protein